MPWAVLLFWSTTVPADPALQVSAATAPVSITPRPASVKSVRLPSITFAFAIDTACDDEWVADSLSVSVADTRLNFGSQQILSGQLDSIELLVPAGQIAPLAVRGFCIDENQRGGNQQSSDKLVVRDVLSAHASLLCATESEQKITYNSQPLDILLTCERSAGDEVSNAAEM